MGIPSFMAVLPTWQFAAIFVGGCVALVVVLTVLVRRSRWVGPAAESAEFIGLTYPMIGAIYGVVLAFTIVLSWERFAEADMHTASEVTYLSSLWRNSQAFGCAAQREIEKRLLAYARSVVDCEWKSLASLGEYHDRTTAAYEEVWHFYRAYVPRSDTEIRFYEVALPQLNELGIERRHRVMSATSEVSGIVWVFLLVGGIVTVVVPMIFWTKLGIVQVTVNGMMAFIVAFSLWIVASLQYPYSGDVSVSDAPFEELIESFKERQDGDQECPAVAGYDLRLIIEPDGDKEEEMIQKFKTEFESTRNDFAVLIVRATCDSRKGTITGFVDEGHICTEVFDGPDLRLMSVDSTDELGDEGRNLIIVGLVGSDLHIRIFDANGEKVVDKAENELARGDALTDLKQRLVALPDDSSLAEQDKRKIFDNATLIAGHTSQELWQELMKEPLNEPRIVELATSTLDRSLASSCEPSWPELQY